MVTASKDKKRRQVSNETLISELLLAMYRKKQKEEGDSKGSKLLKSIGIIL
jgi:hypothetical protein